MKRILVVLQFVALASVGVAEFKPNRSVMSDAYWKVWNDDVLYCAINRLATYAKPLMVEPLHCIADECQHHKGSLAATDGTVSNESIILCIRE